MMQIGLFGGTFNPVHLGHLRVGLEVSDIFRLDKLWLIPCALPPHKSHRNLVGAVDRFEMLRRVVGGSRIFDISDVELKRSGPSFTIDTIRHLKAQAAGEAQFYLLVGLDAFLEIDTWKAHQELLAQVSFIVMARPGRTGADFRDQAKHLEAFIKQQIGTTYQPDRLHGQVCYRDQEKPPVFFIPVTQMDISSTRIRELRHQNRAITYLVPPEVEAYILDKGLYR